MNHSSNHLWLLLCIVAVVAMLYSSSWYIAGKGIVYGAAVLAELLVFVVGIKKYVKSYGR